MLSFCRSTMIGHAAVPRDGTAIGSRRMHERGDEPGSKGMDRLTACVEQLDRLRSPAGISFERGGGALAATIHPASREAGQGYLSRIWRFGLDGGARRLTDGQGSDDHPRFSPVDDRL